MASNLSDLGFVPFGQPTTSTSELSDLGFVPFDQFGENDAERGFFGKIAESFRRGQTGVLANVGVYEALENPDEDLVGALNVRKKFLMQQSLDPVESNWFSDIIYTSSQTAGQVWESVKRGGVGAAVGGLVGAGAGLGAGLLIPTVGEETPLVALGAKTGMKIGSYGAAGIFTYKEGVGGMYAQMMDDGVDPDVANIVAKWAGLPYAAIEVLQLKTLTPSMKKGVMDVSRKSVLKIIGKALKKYGTTLTKEVAEEIGQEIVQITAEDIAKHLSGQDVHVSPDYLKDKLSRVIDVVKAATKGFALLPIPGAVIEASIGIATEEVAQEIEQAKKSAEDKHILKVDDVSHPTAKLDIVLRDSVKTYAKTLKERKREKGLRIGEVEAARKEIESGEWVRAAKQALKGKYTEFDIVPLQEVMPLESYEALLEEVRTTKKLKSLEAMNLVDALDALFKEGKVPRAFEIKYIRRLWGDNVANQLEELRRVTKRGESWIDYLSLAKATAAALDLSRTGRQNITIAFGSPRAWFKSLVTDWHLLLKDEDTARTLEKSMITQLDEYGDLLNKSGIRWNQWGVGAGYLTGTERFSSRIAGKIPGIARSERAYAMGGNYLRGNLLLKIARKRAEAGKFTSDKQWRDIGHVINILTGEGDAKRFGRLAPIFNAAFFAPRLLEARVRTFTDIFNPRLSNVARGILAYHMVSFVLGNLAILGLATQVPGVNVERDWRSTDFGKIKVGNTRIDFWGGYLPMARLITRLATGEMKTQAGRVIPAEWRDTLTTFLQSKLGPAPAFVLDIMRGQTFYGDYVGLDANSLWEQFYHRFVPFVLQDLVDAVKYQGWQMGGIGFGLAFHGVGVQTYPMSPSAALISYKNSLSRTVLGEDWDSLGNAAQRYMRAEFPEIETKERQYAWERGNFRFLNKMAKQREDTRKRITKALPADVREEFASLNLKVSGISRRIASNWFLNEKRFDEYEEITTGLYKDILTDFVRSDLWRSMPPDMKVEVATRIMNEIKTQARKVIINKANINDLQKLERRWE